MKLTLKQYEALQAIAAGHGAYSLTHYVLRVLRKKRLVRKGYIGLTAQGIQVIRAFAKV